MTPDTAVGQSGLSIRERTEGREAETLHPWAAKSAQSAGRLRKEDPCTIRTAYQRDRDRILHSKAFRRLKHKTQMLISPEGDHYRTRLTHTLEVAQVSRTIARALGLNEDLTESIALGHDLGHPPFGHTGERVLDELSKEGYHHQTQGLRIVSILEDLNLSVETLDGMEGLTDAKPAFLTLEAQLVDIADRMAYLHHDVEDAHRAGLMQDSDLPFEILNTLGANRSDRLDRMVIDLIENSRDTLAGDQPRIVLSHDIWEGVMALRQWMFDHVYLTPERIEQTENVRRVITGLWDFYGQKPEALSPNLPQADPLDRKLVDYISGMTDRFAIEAFKTNCLPHPYQSFRMNAL